MDGITVTDVINLVAAATSIILAFLAIGLSVSFYKSSTQSEKNIEVAINKIGEATDTLSKISLRMINRLTNALVSPHSTEFRAEELFKEARKNGFLKDIEDSGSPKKSDLEQFRIDNLIAAMYYSGLSNMSLQTQLPPTIAETQNLSTANLVDQSKADYDTLKGWLAATEDRASKIQKSPIEHMYDNIIDIENSIRSTREFYATLDQSEVASS